MCLSMKEHSGSIQHSQHQVWCYSSPYAPWAFREEVSCVWPSSHTKGRRRYTDAHLKRQEKMGEEEIIEAPVWMGQIKEVFSSPINSVIYKDFHFRALWQLSFQHKAENLSDTLVKREAGFLAAGGEGVNHQWPWAMTPMLPKCAGDAGDATDDTMEISCREGARQTGGGEHRPHFGKFTTLGREKCSCRFGALWVTKFVFKPYFVTIW